MIASRKIVGICLLLFTMAASAAIVTAGKLKGVYVLEGDFVTPDRIVHGKMVIQGDTITCLGTCSAPADATKIKVTDGYIFPGFIDTHQHMQANAAPVWKNTHTYQQRYEWQKDPDHLAFMAAIRAYTATDQGWCDTVRYAEIRQLISGVTTIQGTGTARPCTEGLIRNADGYHDLPLPPVRVVSNIPDVRLFEPAIDWSVTRALAIHLGEGIDEYSRAELDVLEQKGLLRPETLIIHATAFGPPEFARIAKAGAKVVWSPQSNIALYGKSMNVEAAIRAGVDVSLGVDWSPSGSHDILAELKVADRVNREQMHNVVKPRDWIPMITSRPARGLSLEEFVGSLAAGKKADITVLRKRAKNPSASILKNNLSDVEMVWVGGRLLYGDAALVEKLRPEACEQLSASGVPKRICVAGSGTSDTLAQIESRLNQAYPAHIALFN